MGKAGYSDLSDRVFAIDNAGLRTDFVQGLLAARLGNYARGGRNSEDRRNVRAGNLSASQHKRRDQYGAVGGTPQTDGDRRRQKVRGYQKHYVHLSRQPQSGAYAVPVAAERPRRDRDRRADRRVRYGTDGVHDTADRNYCLRLSGDTI